MASYLSSDKKLKTKIDIIRWMDGEFYATKPSQNLFCKKKKNIEKSELISPKDILIGQLKDGILSFL